MLLFLRLIQERETRLEQYDFDRLESLLVNRSNAEAESAED
jgi:hypothetical protein